jgi:plasmid stability protein
MGVQGPAAVHSGQCRKTPASTILLTATAFCGTIEVLTTTHRLSMSELRIREIEDWVADALKARARRHDRTLQEELRTLLRDEVLREKSTLADRAAQRLEKFRDKYGTFSDSAALIREDRDTRG